MESTAEIKRLQGCINDLISVLSLPAIWTGSESSHILGTLLDVLLTMLRLDFAYARLSDASNGPPIEVVRAADRRYSGIQAQQFGQVLDHWLTGDQAGSRCVVPDPAGAGEVSIASFWLGHQQEGAALVAGSRRGDFPTKIEHLLLRVAANQAGIGLQEARRSGEQKRIAEVLEQRVGERTRRLTAVNEELRRSEAYLAEAQRLSRTGSFGWKPSAGEIIWSEETFRIFQYDRTTLPTVELLLQRVHPEDVALVKDTIERATQDGKNFEHEYRLLMPNGFIKHVHVVARGFSDEAGSVEFVGAVMDITDRKRAEEALLRSETYLAEGQRLSHTGSWACNIASREMIHSSEEHRRLFGLDPERAGTPSFDEFYRRIHPEDRDQTIEDLERAIRAGIDVEAHFRVVLPEGTTRYMYGVGHPVIKPSGDIGEFVGTVMDVTERNRAEALRDGESRILEMIARDAPLAEILEKLVRVVEAQFAGLLCSVLLLDDDGQHVRHGAAPSLPKPYSDAIDGLCIGPKAGSCGTAMYRREPVVVTDILEDPLWEDYRSVAEPFGLRACWSTPILAHSGKALGTFAMYYREPRSPSTGETRALEMATHLAGIAIERKLTREERERLRQAQADIARISRVNTMGELTASLAHEVNQPIAAAVTDAKTCLRWLTRDQPDVEEAREAATRVVKDSTRAAEIISRTRLLFKKGAPLWESVDVNEIIRDIVALMRSEVTQHSISVQTELAEDVPQITGDHVQLQQVLMNLILNSIDAMKDIDGTRELVICSQRGDDGQLMVSVRDTGVGLPPQQADQIFNAFFTTKAHGTGMGLRISRSIVESHGGRLWAGANSQRGASFYITLPAHLEAA
jgi:PAS domain S-box-containing protein